MRSSHCNSDYGTPLCGRKDSTLTIGIRASIGKPGRETPSPVPAPKMGDGVDVIESYRERLPSRIYRGSGGIIDGAVRLVVRVEDYDSGEQWELVPIKRHGSGNLGIGYGPASIDTALTILTDLLGPEGAETCYKAFHYGFLWPLHLRVGRCFNITSAGIAGWLKALEN